MDKWTYELNLTSDIWRGGIFDTREEAIKEANEEATLDEIKEFKVGIIENATNYGIDVNMIIEDIQTTMYEEVGEVAEDYLDDVTKEHRLELEKELNEVFYKWQKKYNYKPTFYKVISEEVVEVQEECPCMTEKSLNCGMKCSRCGREL